MVRHFWHQILPRVKYRNPAIPMQVTRHLDPLGPAYLHIFTSKTPATSVGISASSSGTHEAKPTHTIDIKTLTDSEILEKLIEKTGAEMIQATLEELTELQEITEFKIKAEKDRVEVREKLEAQRREEELLRLARGDVLASA